MYCILWVHKFGMNKHGVYDYQQKWVPADGTEKPILFTSADCAEVFALDAIGMSRMTMHVCRFM